MFAAQGATGTGTDKSIVGSNVGYLAGQQDNGTAGSGLFFLLN